MAPPPKIGLGRPPIARAPSSTSKARLPTLSEELKSLANNVAQLQTFVQQKNEPAADALANIIDQRMHDMARRVGASGDMQERTKGLEQLRQFHKLLTSESLAYKTLPQRLWVLGDTLQRFDLDAAAHLMREMKGAGGKDRGARLQQEATAIAQFSGNYEAREAAREVLRQSSQEAVPSAPQRLAVPGAQQAMAAPQALGAALKPALQPSNTAHREAPLARKPVQIQINGVRQESTTHDHPTPQPFEQHRDATPRDDLGLSAGSSLKRRSGIPRRPSHQRSATKPESTVGQDLGALVPPGTPAFHDAGEVLQRQQSAAPAESLDVPSELGRRNAMSRRVSSRGGETTPQTKPQMVIGQDLGTLLPPELTPSESLSGNTKPQTVIGQDLGTLLPPGLPTSENLRQPSGQLNFLPPASVQMAGTERQFVGVTKELSQPEAIQQKHFFIQGDDVLAPQSSPALPALPAKIPHADSEEARAALLVDKGTLTPEQDFAQVQMGPEGITFGAQAATPKRPEPTPVQNAPYVQTSNYFRAPQVDQAYRQPQAYQVDRTYYPPQAAGQTYYPPQAGQTYHPPQPPAMAPIAMRADMNVQAKQGVGLRSAAPTKPARKAGKVKISERLTQALGLCKVENWDGKEVDLRVSEIMGESGKLYFMTNTLHKGSFGKIRYAIDEFGKKWAIKEVRSDEWVNTKTDWRGRPVKPKTAITKMREANKENGILKALGMADVIKTKDGKVYTAMEVMDGEAEKTLEALLPTLPMLVRREVGLSFLEQYANGLKKLHDLGWIHLDIKPPNALVNRTGVIKVADFGLAEKKGSSGYVKTKGQGTPGYVAPEVIEGAPANETADTFSLAFSFCDMHVHWSKNPLSWPETPKQIADSYAGFKTFYQKLVAVEGQGPNSRDTLDLSRIPKGGGTNWDEYFDRLRTSAGEEVTLQILTHMLNPNAQKRVSDMTRVSEFAKSQQKAERSDEQTKMKQMWLNQLGVDKNRDGAYKGIEKYRQARPTEGFADTRFTPLRPRQ